LNFSDENPVVAWELQVDDLFYMLLDASEG